MPTRNVVLTDHQQELIATLVQSGQYQNASEVLREGLRLIGQRERLEAAKLKALQEAADIAWVEITADRYNNITDDQLDDFISQLGQSAAARAQSAV